MNTLRLTLILALAGALGSLLMADTAALEERIRQLEQQLAAQQQMLAELKAELSRQAEDVKNTAAEASKKEAGAEMKKANLFNWKFGGDVRLRYEGTFWDGGTFPDRNRYRMRARLHITSDFGHGVSGRLQLASGLSIDPGSTNQTFTDSFDRKDIWLDQAYITWAPEALQDHFTFGGGKFANPYVYTPMVWDADVNPEGFYQKLSFGNSTVSPFLTLGQMMIKENALKADAYALGYQGGLRVRTGDATWILALAYYDYIRYDINYKYPNGNTVDTSGSQPVLDAGDFDILDFVAQASLDGWRYPVSLFFDYARNLDASGPYADEDTAWSVGGILGRNRDAHDWSVAARYAYVEPNAVVGAFTESDFGYANRKGSELKFKYNFYRPLTLGVAFYWTDPVVEIARDPWNRVQVDLEYKF